MTRLEYKVLGLRIKINNLGDESRSIKAQEVRLLRRLRRSREKLKQGKVFAGLVQQAADNIQRREYSLYELRTHRLFVVRPTARINHLANGFLAGRTYAEVENQTRPDRPKKVRYAAKWDHPKPAKPIDWKKVREVVARFGDKEQLLAFDAWAKIADTVRESRMLEMPAGHNRPPKRERARKTLEQWQAEQAAAMERSACPGCGGEHARQAVQGGF